MTVAASGTSKTLKPSYYSAYCSSASAVVLPAQGPPVTQILVIGFFSSFIMTLNSESA
jgi:hypothetical protein